jgi:hypothetical protein
VQHSWETCCAPSGLHVILGFLAVERDATVKESHSALRATVRSARLKVGDPYEAIHIDGLSRWQIHPPTDDEFLVLDALLHSELAIWTDLQAYPRNPVFGKGSAMSMLGGIRRRCTLWAAFEGVKVTQDLVAEGSSLVLSNILQGRWGAFQVLRLRFP